LSQAIKALTYVFGVQQNLSTSLEELQKQTNDDLEQVMKNIAEFQ
jgi:hypothetical protein